MSALALWAAFAAWLGASLQMMPARPLLRLLLICVPLGAAIACLNDLYDARVDYRSRLRACPIALGQVRPGAAALVAALLAAAGLVVALVSGLLIYAALILAVWALYSIPPVRLKQRLFLGTLCNLLGGGLLGLLGAAAARATLEVAVWPGAFCGLLLAAGHLNHGAADIESHRSAGCDTVAVRFGPRAALCASLVLIMLSTVVLRNAAVRGIVPWATCAPLAVASLGYLIAWVYVSGEPTFARILTFRAIYRWMYIILGAMSIILPLVVQRHAWFR